MKRHALFLFTLAVVAAAQSADRRRGAAPASSSPARRCVLRGQWAGV